jgi:hypothetical protein
METTMRSMINRKMQPRIVRIPVSGVLKLKMSIDAVKMIKTDRGMIA